MTPTPGAGSSRAPGPPEVMTIDDLARYLQLSKSSLYKLAQDGKVPGQKVGRHWRFHKTAIDAWLIAGDEDQRRGAKRPRLGADDE